MYISALIGSALLISVLPLNDTSEFEPIFDVPLIIILLGIFWFGVCITRQRANDISGKHPFIWLFLALFLMGPIIGLIPGEKQNNKYGPVPDRVNLFNGSNI